MATYTGADVAGFTAYHEERGRTVPGTWDDAKINASLLVASEWIDDTYGSSFIGEKVGGFLQEREWPRVNAVVPDPRYIYVIPTDEIPEKVIHAVYEATFRDATTPGSLLVDYTPGKYNSVSIDGAVSVDYRNFTSAFETQTTYPIIDRLLKDLMDLRSTSSTYSSPLLRV